MTSCGFEVMFASTAEVSVFITAKRSAMVSGAPVTAESGVSGSSGNTSAWTFHSSTSEAIRSRTRGLA